MNGQEAEEKCRICMEGNAELDWKDLLSDHSHLTYKDCYYKYTKLEYIDADNFSSWLCRDCSNSLEFIDAFLSKAIESHQILQKNSINAVIKDEASIQHKALDFETILVEGREIKPEILQPETENIHENSSEEFSTVPADESCMIPETSATLLTQTRKLRQCKPKKKKEKFENSGVHLPCDESPLDEKKLSMKTDQPICCSVCSKVLSSKYIAIEHEKIHIQHRERNETCENCGLKFYSKNSLRSHMVTHLENREKIHKCEFCDKAFYNKGGLNIHRRIHLGQMISCNLCTKQFYRQIDLDKHMASHYATRITSDVKIRKRLYARCKDCGENVRSTSFKSHMAKHINEPLFKCSICNKEFFFRMSCRKHLKTTHKKPPNERSNFIIAYKTDRLNHLFLKQNSTIEEINHE